MVIQSSKREKLQEEDCLAIFKPLLWQMSFSDEAKNGTIFLRGLNTQLHLKVLFFTNIYSTKSCIQMYK